MWTLWELVCAEGGWDFPGGTIVFAAPELLLAARSNRNEDAPPCWVSCSPPIDCWSYGLTALELLTGCCLFAPDKTARPSDIGCEGEHDYLGRMKYTADLHGDWVRGGLTCYESPTFPWLEGKP